jgi:hypothetical protein
MAFLNRIIYYRIVTTSHGIRFTKDHRSFYFSTQVIILRETLGPSIISVAVVVHTTTQIESETTYSLLVLVPDSSRR